MRNYTQHPVDMMTFPFSGISGYMTWYGWEPKTHYLWPATIRAQQYMNGDDVIGTLSEGGGNWGHGKQESELKPNNHVDGNLVEHQYYGGYHADLTVGYVKNRTFNIKTNNCNNVLIDYPDNIISISKGDVKLNNKLMIISLKNLTHYYVDWYSYNTGTYIKTDYKKTSFNGNLKLDFPVLTSANPVVWYVVHQNAYSGLIQGQTPIAEREQVLFEYQEVDNDTTSIEFKNSIYPNPFNNKIVVNSLEDDVFMISTLTGAILIKHKVHKGMNHISLMDLPKGLYFGKLIDQKFIIKLERL